MGEQSSVGRRRLAAILAGDVAGYSRLMTADESSTIAALDAARAVFRARIEAHHGRVIDMAGDSVLAVFETATGAVSAALGVQRQLEAMAAGLPADRRLRFRIGVHLGEVVEKADGSVYGDGVNIAARIEGLALPGGVTISDAVQGAVRHRITATFDDLGEQQVKNIADPVHVYRVLDAAEGGSLATGRIAWRWSASQALRGRRPVVAGLVLTAVALAAAAWQWRQGSAPGGDIVPIPMSLAVGRIAAAVGGDAATRSEADLLAQDLETGLGAFERRVKVVSIDREAKAAASARERALLAGARYIAEGELQRSTTQRQLSLRLVETRGGALAWSQRFDVADGSDAPAASVAMRHIMAQLTSALIDAEIRRLRAKPERSLDGTELMVRAWAVLAEGGSLAAANEGRRLLTEALRLEPTLSEACVTMIWSLHSINDLDPQFGGERFFEEVDKFSARAVALDEGSSRAWLSRATALSGLGRWNASRQAHERAVMLDPYSPRPYIVGAEFLIVVGQPADALAMTEKALTLRPLNLDGILGLQCMAHVLLGDTEKAIPSCERASGLQAKDVGLYSLLAAAYANAGDTVNARAAVAAMLAISPDATIALLRSKGYSKHPRYQGLLDKYWYDGLRRAGLPEQ